MKENAGLALVEAHPGGLQGTDDAQLVIIDFGSVLFLRGSVSRVRMMDWLEKDLRATSDRAGNERVIG